MEISNTWKQLGIRRNGRWRRKRSRERGGGRIFSHRETKISNSGVSDEFEEIASTFSSESATVFCMKPEVCYPARDTDLLWFVRCCSVKQLAVEVKSIEWTAAWADTGGRVDRRSLHTNSLALQNLRMERQKWPSLEASGAKNRREAGVANCEMRDRQRAPDHDNHLYGKKLSLEYHDQLPFLDNDRNVEEMERDQKKKKKKNKRGRREENFYYNDIEQPAKKQDREHYSYGDSGSCSKDDSDSSSENHVALGVFDFPWMHEGIVSKSEDWDYLEDTFSVSLEDTCFRGRIQISESLYETSCASATADEEKRRVNFKQSDDGLAVEQEMDRIWASLLNQPLQQGGCSLLEC
ncbi:hypothetical protein PTKIN_Ptkin18bG0156100 [Pterospermum kingtungense]